MNPEQIDALPMDEVHELVLNAFWRISEVLAEVTPYHIRKRPMLGGIFGGGSFLLCSYSRVLCGLDEVYYFVMDADSQFVISNRDSRQAAIADARGVLEKLGIVKLHTRFGKFKQFRIQSEIKRAEAREAELVKRREQWSKERSATVKSIPKRRKKIFDESGGKCHYCATALTLDGRWHVEHKMPKALGGDNAPGNLVAACAPCNHEKRDTTDQEFIAKRAARAA